MTSDCNGSEGVCAVVFDWAGTVVDFGSRAPIAALVETFAAFGVPVGEDEARRPMGLAKRPHVAALLAQPRVARAWAERYGAPPGEAAIDQVYDAFVPRNIAVAASHATLIPGAAETRAFLRARGIRVGSTTGYTREIMAEILPVAGAQGFDVDALVCAGDTPSGRPSPLMMWRALMELDVWPAWRAVKIDDTEVGVAEGVNAGAWSIGVAVSGNVFGCSEAELASLSPQAFAARRAHAKDRLLAAGAHLVIDSVADLPQAIETLESRLRQGMRPAQLS